MTRFLRIGLSCLCMACIALLSWSNESNANVGAEDYTLPDSRLALEMIDSSEQESFLSVKVDTEGNLFVGSREALFVYEPDGEGGFNAPIELYRFAAHSWIYGVEIRGDDLYVSTVTTLYLMPGGRTQRESLEVQPLIWGMPVGSYPNPTYGVHQGMHGIAWGPEGDLYLSFGDAQVGGIDFTRPDHWLHWHFYTPRGEEIPYNGTGGIIRLRPDGTGYQIYSTGLRNPCGLAFDDRWNLFTHDNDHESQPAGYVPGRLLYASPGVDFAWPRGWMLTKTPDRPDLVRTMADALGRTVPVGQSYYQESRLPEEYHDTILLARWGQRSVEVFPKWAEGSAFRAERVVLLRASGQGRPVAVAPGPDGRIYVGVCFMGGNDKSPIYRSELLVIDNANPEPLPSPQNLTNAEPQHLYALLEDRSWELQHAAHVEILRRGGEVLQESVAKLEAALNENGSINQNLIHLAAATESEGAHNLLRSLSRHENTNIRLQAVRAMSEYAEQFQSEDFSNPLQDSAGPVQLAALAGWVPQNNADVETLFLAACSDDSYIRQAAVRSLEKNLSIETLGEYANASNPKIRLAAVMGLGRQLTIPPQSLVPPASIALGEPYGSSIYVDQELIHLDEIHPVGTYTSAKLWAAIPHTEDQERQFALLIERLEDDDESVRMQAALYLSYLRDDRAEPLLEEVWRNATVGQLADVEPLPIDKAWVLGPFADRRQMLDIRHAPEHGPVDLNAEYESGGESLTWYQAENNEGNFNEFLTPIRGGNSTYFFFHVESATDQKVWLDLQTNRFFGVWQNGVSIFYQPQNRRNARGNTSILVSLTRGTNAFFLRVQAPENSEHCSFHIRALSPISVELPSRDSASLEERLRNTTGQGLTPEELEAFLALNWPNEVEEGDPQRGSQLFASIGCAKCHATTSELPVSGGPSLAEARRRFTVDFLVESILVPSTTVADAFSSSTVVLTDGRILSGLILSKTETHLELLQNDAERIEIALADIEETQHSATSAMPTGLVKSTDELRDILSYLLRPEASDP